MITGQWHRVLGIFYFNSKVACASCDESDLPVMVLAGTTQPSVWQFRLIIIIINYLARNRPCIGQLVICTECTLDCIIRSAIAAGPFTTRPGTAENKNICIRPLPPSAGVASFAYLFPRLLCFCSYKIITCSSSSMLSPGNFWRLVNPYWYMTSCIRYPVKNKLSIAKLLWQTTEGGSVKKGNE